MRTIKKLKIGYQTYEVKENSVVLKELGLCGRMNRDKHIIEYSLNFPPAEIADTLVHEVLHAISANYLYDVDRADEEETVTMLAHGLTQVMKDNPKFSIEIQSLLK